MPVYVVVFWDHYYLFKSSAHSQNLTHFLLLSESFFMNLTSMCLFIYLFIQSCSGYLTQISLVQLNKAIK